MNDQIDTHESYGLVNFLKVSNGRGKRLFGSSIDHQHTIMLRISTASKYRNLSQNWYSDDKHLIEVEMSNDQFAELITTMNCGQGSPCTIRRLNGKGMQDPPPVSNRELFENEFKEKAAEITKNAETLLGQVNDCLDDKVVSKTKLREAVKTLGSVIMQIKNNLPFTYDQFNRSMDKTVVEAKAEVEAFTNHLVRTVGLEAIKNQVPQITDGK